MRKFEINYADLKQRIAGELGENPGGQHSRQGNNLAHSTSRPRNTRDAKRVFAFRFNPGREAGMRGFVEAVALVFNSIVDVIRAFRGKKGT
jgi:hypothetical protein